MAQLVDAVLAGEPGPVRKLPLLRRLARKLTEACPVDIFAQSGDGRLVLVEANLDECVLCRLCLDAVPDGVRVLKLYEGGVPL